MVIAIDGPAGAGKSTIARILAKRLGFVYLDTGAIYRALTLKALNQNMDFSDEQGLIGLCKNTQIEISNNKDGSIKVVLDSKDVSSKIRLPEVTKYVSTVARISGVRIQMLELQRSIGSANNSVIDGRDIGTVVFPNADKKFYLDAEFNERIRRRYKELKELKVANNQISLQEVESDVKNRDYLDSNRKCAPLRKADDAIYIDTTDLTIEEVVNKLVQYL